jgi:MFS family permease
MVFVAGAILPALAATPGPQRTIRPALGVLLHRPGFLACLLATLGGCFGFGVFMTFLPLHLASLGMDASHVGLVFAVQALANALSRIPFGRLSDWVADRGTLVVGGLSTLTVAVALTGLSSELPELFACAALLGVSMGVAFTALSALIADIVPHELRGMAMGGYNSCIYLGMMASASTMGGVIARYGYATGFMGASAATLVMTWSFRNIYRRARTNLPV